MDSKKKNKNKKSGGAMDEFMKEVYKLPEDKIDVKKNEKSQKKSTIEGDDGIQTDFFFDDVTNDKSEENEPQSEQLSANKNEAKIFNNKKVVKSENAGHNDKLNKKMHGKNEDEDNANNQERAKPYEFSHNKGLSKEDLKAIQSAKKAKGFSLKNAERYDVSPKEGLIDKQVGQRISEGYANVVIDKNAKTYLGIVLSNICTFFNLLCAIVAISLIAVGAFDNVFFMVIILANISIGIIQEIRAKNTINKITLVTAPTAMVIRNGKKYEIPVNAIVLDDICEYSLGRQIGADCIVVEGEVECNESLLTGESVPVKKRKGDTLLSGSFVTSGNCLARAEYIGDASYSAQLAIKAKEFKKPQSELLKSLRIIITVIGAIIIPLGFLMLMNNLSQLEGAETIKKTAGSLIGMIPAGMFLLTSMALAVGVIKLAKKRTLVQDLYSIEMLSRTNVLCLDKTGTLTDGTMKLAETVELGNVSGDDLHKIMGSMLGALKDNNATSLALIAHYGNSGTMSSTATMPFNSTRKCSAVTFSNGWTYVLGAPEFVLESIEEDLQEKIDLYTKNGQRVLVLARGKGKIDKEKLPKVKEIALFAIEDRIREDAEKTINWFKNNEVEIKIISGDNPITVSEIARKVGVPNADKYINLYGLSDKQVVDAVNKYSIFGRVSPEQKSLIVKALKQNGQKVAMTGDGVNDILALKEADCSIAMASGSDATKNVSNLVLLDSNFSSMPSVVGEGRRVVNNITKSSSLFLMKTLFTILLSILCLAIGLSYPFSPNDILLLEICAIGIPSFFLALQPNNDPIKGNFLVNLVTKALPGGFLLLIAFVACYLFDIKLGTGNSYITMASIAICFTGLVLLIRVCRPLDLYRIVLIGSMLVLSGLALTIIPRSFFDYVKLDLTQVLFIVAVVEFGFLWLLKPIMPSKEAYKRRKQRMEIRVIDDNLSR